jgi:Ca2+-binding EF-hand superfamily protein
MTSAPELREQNLGLLFDLLDTDQDGYLVEDDPSASGRRVLDEFAITDTQQRGQVESAYRAWWQRLREDCDSDGDGRITRQEFIAAHLSGGGDPHRYYQEIVAPIVAVVAGAVDQDSDGFIQAADYARMFASQGIDGRIAGAVFESLDADADGRISIGELLDAVTQLFLSQDSADPGTAMLGP